jgi:hypothetical protein
MRRSSLAVVVLAVFAAASSFFALTPAGAQGPGGPGGPGGGRPPGMNMAPDSFAAERDSLTRLVMERIKGRENAPAESVYKNIKLMKGRTAEQVLRAMNSFGRTLGVSCRHCHVENHWADEDKPAKQIARDMRVMTGTINDSLLTRVSFKPDEHPHVSCFTCHRGHTNPNFGMGRPPGAPAGQPGPGGQPPQGDRR